MLREYLLNNVGELEKIIHEINSYDGSLYYLEVYENDSWFFEEFFDKKPAEAVRATVYGNYNYNDEYVKFDGYENLESLSEWQYKRLLEQNVDQVIVQLFKNKNYIHLSEEVESIIEEEED